MKIQIGLFFGGNSVEHEVSVISALQAFGQFDREKYSVLPVYISRNSEFYTGEAAGHIEEYKDPKALMAKCTQVFCRDNEVEVERHGDIVFVEPLPGRKPGKRMDAVTGKMHELITPFRPEVQVQIIGKVNAPAGINDRTLREISLFACLISACGSS